MSRRSRERGTLWDQIRDAEFHVIRGEDTRPGREHSLPRHAKERLARKGVAGLAHAILGLKAAPSSGSVRNAVAWARIKALIVFEHGAVCEACEVAMPDEALLHLHHITPHAKGGRDSRENAALLCPNCHVKAHWLYSRLEQIPADHDALLTLLRKEVA